MTSGRHWAVLVLALFVACPPSSAEAEPKAEAAAETKPVYDDNAGTRSSSRFGGSRSINLGLTRDTDYPHQAGLGSSRTDQFGTKNQFGRNSQLGSTGYQADQFGVNRFGGSSLDGTSHFGTLGLRNNQFGTNQFGAGGLGSSQYGTTGSVANRFGSGGLGSSQFGTSSYGTNQFGTGGLTTSRFGASGLTSNNRFGTNQFGATGLRNNQFGSNRFGTTGFGSRTSQFGTNQNTRFGTNPFETSTYGSNQLGSNRFGSNQFNRNSLHSGFATDGGIFNQRLENDGTGQYSFGRQGHLDNFGSALTDHQNQFQTSNLHNLVSQNRNALSNGGYFLGSSTSAGVGGFNRNNPAGFETLGYTSPTTSG